MHMLHVHSRGTKAFTWDARHMQDTDHETLPMRDHACARRANLSLSVASRHGRHVLLAEGDAHVSHVDCR
jgi:hypothetical protein